jgi:hypothetical protein
VDSNHRPHDYESCTGCERRRNAVKLGQGPPGNRGNRWWTRVAGVAGRVRNCRRLVAVVGPPIGCPWARSRAGRWAASIRRARDVRAGFSRARFHAKALAAQRSRLVDFPVYRGENRPLGERGDGCAKRDLRKRLRRDLTRLLGVAPPPAVVAGEWSADGRACPRVGAGCGREVDVEGRFVGHGRVRSRSATPNRTDR